MHMKERGRNIAHGRPKDDKADRGCDKEVRMRCGTRVRKWNLQYAKRRRRESARRKGAERGHFSGVTQGLLSVYTGASRRGVVVVPPQHPAGRSP